MGDLIKLTSINYMNPAHVMRSIYIIKNKILFMTRDKDEYTSIIMSGAYMEEVKELPEDINKDVNLLKFTSYETDKPVYIAKDAIVGFLEESSQATCVNLICDKFNRPTFKNGVTVKESAEEIEKIIEGE